MAGRIKDKVEFYIKFKEERLEELEIYWAKLVEEIYYPIDLDEKELEDEIIFSLKDRKFILSERFIRQDIPEKQIKFKSKKLKEYEKQISNAEDSIGMFKDILQKASSKK